MEIVAVGCRCLLALVFLASASGKLRPRALDAFRSSLVRAQLLPRATVAPVTLLLVGAEAFAVPLLLVPATASVGAGLSALLLVGFSAGILLLRHRGTELACHCFGTTGSPLGVRHLARNGVLLTACLAVVVPTTASARPPALVLAAVAAALAAVVVIRLDDIVDLLGPGRDD